MEEGEEESLGPAKDISFTMPLTKAFRCTHVFCDVDGCRLQKISQCTLMDAVVALSTNQGESNISINQKLAWLM